MKQLRTIIMGAGLILALAGSAKAQTGFTQVRPNGLGGYNVYSPGGSFTQVQPNGLGGYNSYGPGGSFSQSMPNGLGGYNIYSHPGFQPPPPPVFRPMAPTVPNYLGR